MQSKLQSGVFMDFHTVVGQFHGRLSDADQRLIQVLLSQPTQAAFYSANDLASQAGVHAATVVRLAKKLGFTGYPELRSSLADRIKATDTSQRLRRTLHKSDILGNLIGEEQNALAHIVDHVRQSDLERLGRAILQAGHVYLFAQGHATAVIEYLERRLRRFGLHTVNLCLRGRDLAEAILSFSQKDLLLVCALRRLPKEYAVLHQHVKDQGGKVGVLADTIGPLLRPQPDVLIHAPRGQDSEFQTLNVPLLIVSALLVTIAKCEPKTLENLDKLSRLIDNLEETV
jgi:DNA-binding MurR/RpiR family transcriptional regulator